jgi:hypothetical protein
MSTYGAEDGFPKPILQTRFETAVEDDETYSQAKIVAITAMIGTAIWIIGFLYVLIAVVTHGTA